MLSQGSGLWTDYPEIFLASSQDHGEPQDPGTQPPLKELAVEVEASFQSILDLVSIADRKLKSGQPLGDKFFDGVSEEIDFLHKTLSSTKTLESLEDFLKRRLLSRVSNSLDVLKSRTQESRRFDSTKILDSYWGPLTSRLEKMKGQLPKIFDIKFED